MTEQYLGLSKVSPVCYFANYSSEIHKSVYPRNA